MEYGTESNTNIKYFTIFDGHIISREQEGTPGTTTRETSTGKTVHELAHDFISGMITGGGIEIKEFGGKKVPEIQVILDDEGMLQIPMYLLSSIGEVIPNIDPMEPIKFRTYKTKKGKLVLEVSQGGAKLESNYVDWNEEDGKWTPTYKNGLPQPTFDEIDGWDFRDHDKFLKKVVIEFFEQFSDAPAVLADAGFVPSDDDVPF